MGISWERGRPARMLIPLWRSLSVSATWQPACRCEPQRPNRERPPAPFRVDPSGGDGRGCASALCGRDARAPRGAIIHAKNREHGLHHAQKSGKAPFASPKNHSPLEGGVGETRAQPTVEPEGGKRGVPEVTISSTRRATKRDGAASTARVATKRIINIDAQDKQDERLLHRKPARAMVRWGIADSQEYKLAVS